EELTLDHIAEVLTQLEYHTHQAEGVAVCTEFLLGCCFYGKQCLQHHTTLPYHWQLQKAETQRWESVPEEAQELLERFYCDPEKEYIRMNIQGRILDKTVDHRSVRVLKLPFTTVYKIATPFPSASCNETPRGTGAAWKCATCQCHPTLGTVFPHQPFVQCIEAALNQGASETRCSTLEHGYVLNLAEGYQQNVTTGTKRLICKRPVFQSPVLLLPQLRTLSGTSYMDGPSPPSLPLSAAPNGPYPETWISMDSSLDFLQVPMSMEDRGYRIVYGLFHKTMPESKYMILGIKRMQNQFLWDKYKRKREHMSRKMSEHEKLLNEKHLFHGTSSSAISAICKQNFDPRLSGKHATLYGQGSYFARRSVYSHRYAQKSPDGAHYVFLSKVLVGKFTLGKPNMRRPPALCPENPSSDLYDSCVDSMTDPQIFVVFDNDQCYPYFIIKYKEIEENITVL
uniref:Poly [ADP-ribose] polymerase n=1 Tax=Latimeria chalumnae TaxID=7897 RepID=H3AK28_LATCH